MNEKKIFWIKWIMLIIVAAFSFMGYVTFDPYQSGVCAKGNGCMFSSWRKNISEPTFLSSLFIIISLIFTFFISDTIFKKWLKFASIWFLVDVILIIGAPVSSGGAIISNPTKESISIWMGSLFFIISLIIFVVLTVKEKRK